MNSELSWTDTRVLVTGGAGFIGSHLAQKLARDGATVTVLDNLRAGKWENVPGNLKPETGNLKRENRRQKTEDRRRKTEDRRPKSDEGPGRIAPRHEIPPRSVGVSASLRNPEPVRHTVPTSAGASGCGLGQRVPDPESTHPVAPARLISASADFGGSALRCIEADVRNADQVAEIVRDFSPEYTFHLAANASVPGSAENPRYDFESNATGTYNILEACRGLRGLRKIVVVSSGAVYGEPASFPITEASPLAPISPYGASKLVAETEARMFESAYSVPAVIARIFNTYGPRMPRFVVFDFLRKLQRNPDVLEVLGSGRQVRDLNYVTDTVAGLILLAEKGATGESYNLASGRHHNVTEIARELLDVLGLSGRTKLAFTGESWDGDAQRWEVDIGKLRQLGYEPEIGLKEGLRRVAAWFETVHGRLPRGDEES